jgi:hypothetical protein
MNKKVHILYAQLMDNFFTTITSSPVWLGFDTTYTTEDISIVYTYVENNIEYYEES